MFAEILKQLRRDSDLSQQQLADKLFVNRSAVANWESGRRIPDAMLMKRIAECFGIDVSILVNATVADSVPPNVIVVDDEKIQLSGAVSVVSKAMPQASVTGFTKVSDAISFAENNLIAIAFLDIEIGKHSGLELCDRLMELNHNTNVIFLTGYSNYAMDAWSTKASGFLLKPLLIEDVKMQLAKLRHPVGGME